jgi:hypothetical protein
MSDLDQRTGRIYTNLNFWTKALPELNEFYFNFYSGKEKRIPLDLSLLTPLAIAHWVMQDGFKVISGGLYLCTDVYSYIDIKRLTEYLYQEYNIKCYIHKHRKNYRIYIHGKSLIKLKSLILPFMHETMKYKLGV